MYELHLLISGMVQGVNFRSFVRSGARELGLTGWVKNLPDGRVEVLAQGEKSDLDLFLSVCNEGSRWARVDHVEEEWIRDPTIRYLEFKIL